MKDGVIKGLKASGHPVAVSGGEILDWGYKIADAIIKADKDDKLGEKELEVSASGPETEKITWHFSKKGDWFGYSSWNYTVDFEIVRTPVSTADETSNTLYQRHDSGFIWRYTGTPMTGWQKLD
ncbi:hypothetical protein, partial [Arthrobacter sp. 179]